MIHFHLSPEHEETAWSSDPSDDAFVRFAPRRTDDL